MIQVKTFYAFNELRNFSYLLYEDTTGEAWVIDPYEASPLIDYIKKNSLTLKGILNTHRHFDHIRGNLPLQEAFHSPVMKLHDLEKVVLNSDSYLETLDTPGHTLDHQVFLLKGLQGPQALFSGDTLFNSGVGNCKNGGSVDLLFESTMKLMALPGETLLYPGHDYAQRNLEFAHSIEPDNARILEELRRVQGVDVTKRAPEKLSDEKLVNPFLRLSSEQVRKLLDHESLSERNLFHTIRNLRDQW